MHAQICMYTHTQTHTRLVVQIGEGVSMTGISHTKNTLLAFLINELDACFSVAFPCSKSIFKGSTDALWPSFVHSFNFVSATCL